jgi:shikimate kinase
VNIYLIGYRGSGKTSVAAALARRLRWPWLDADEEIERRAGKSIAQIFADQQATGFRDLESAVVAELAARDRHIIALGGGAILREENRRTITNGKVIWLKASPEQLLARIQADPTTAERRPNLTPQGGLEEIRKLLAERMPLYAACANLAVDVEQKTPDEIAKEIADWLSKQEAQ